MQQNRKGVTSILWMAGIIALGVSGGLIVANSNAVNNLPGLSSPSTPGGTSGFACGDAPVGEITEDNCGDTRDVQMKATDRADSATPQIEVDSYLYEGSDVTSGSGAFVATTTLSNSGLTGVSGLRVGDQYSAVAYNDTYPYANPVTQVLGVDDRAALDAWTNTGSSNVGTTFFDEDDSSATTITINSGETYVAEGLRVSAGAEDTAYNAHVLTFNMSQISGSIDEVRVQGADAIDEPNNYASAFQDTHVAFDSGDLLAGEEPLLGAHEKMASNAIEFDMQDGQDPSGEIQVCVDDLALYQADDDSTQQGLEDDNNNDVGSSKACQKITIN
jgi:hypothetical protein